MGAQVSREPPPPLPGGYTVGEQVYYMGASQTVESGFGYRLEHGTQGEVTGYWPTTCESHTGNGLVVRFIAGHACNIYLSQVCCRARLHLY